MRLNEIENSWRPWQQGQDNSNANIDIPLMEGLDPANLPLTVKKILSTKDEEFGPSMTLEEALAYCRRLSNGKE